MLQCDGSHIHIFLAVSQHLNKEKHLHRVNAGAVLIFYFVRLTLNLFMHQQIDNIHSVPLGYLSI